MDVSISLLLIDAGVSRPEETLGLVADDFIEALEVYEQTYARGDSEARAFTVQHVTLSTGFDAHERLSDVDEALPVYAIACTDDVDAGKAIEALERLENTCAGEGIPYKGGVAVAGGRLVAPCARGPRMGRMRRRCSEAIDRLILAVRSQCAVGQLLNPSTFPKRDASGTEDANGASNTILATCPVPAFLYDVTARFYEKRMTR